MAKASGIWVVVNSDGNVSWSAKTEAPEQFSTPMAARRRAVEIAESNPGEPCYVCKAVGKAVAKITAPIGAATIESL